jgi:hypothetical protein
MKKVFAISIAILVFSFQIAGAQQVVNVAPGLNTLVDAIAVATSGDVFVLQRNAGYAQQVLIDVNVPITVKAADGEGDLPILVPAQAADGSWPGANFRLYADITLENLAFTGIRVEGDRGARVGSMFSMAADNLRAVIDGCTFVGYGGRTLEPGRDGATLIVKNCIETGNGRSNRVDNGRFVDCRAASVDTIILQHCTLLNCADRWIRHMFEDASAEYILFDHNTFMNGTGYRPSFQFRNVKELYFTNNIVANPSMLGTTQAGIRKDELEYDRSEGVCTFTHAGADTSNQVMVFRNNNVWRDPRIDTILGGLDLANGDSVEIAPLFNSEIKSRINVDLAVFSEPLTFGHSPTIDSLLPELEIYVSGAKGYSHSAFIFRTDEHALGLDMNYGTTAQSYTAADGGFPLGDLNWYPDKKAEWVTDVATKTTTPPLDFELLQNYPNPFNPQTNIAYHISRTADVSLVVFNILGQKIRTLINEQKMAGSYRLTWDGRDNAGKQLPGGIYFYQLKAGSYTATRKMIMAK